MNGTLGPNFPKIENAQKLLKFGTLNILNMPISSILMSKMIFTKYLRPVRPKFLPKLKVLIFY